MVVSIPSGYAVGAFGWLLVARGDCGSAHSKVATFEKIDKRTIGNRLAPQIDKRAIDNA